MSERGPIHTGPARLPGLGAPVCALRPVPTGTVAAPERATREELLQTLRRVIYAPLGANLQDHAIQYGRARLPRTQTAPITTGGPVTGRRVHATEAGYATVPARRGMGMIPARLVPVSKVQAIGVLAVRSLPGHAARMPANTRRRVHVPLAARPTEPTMPAVMRILIAHTHLRVIRAVIARERLNAVLVPG
jgi:hypothetical protein